MPCNISRPEWDDWYVALAAVISQRSYDPSTKHGCVVVAEDRSVLSVGYNAPPRGCADEKIPLTRPEKYSFFEHAESNAINNAAREGIALEGSTFYVTGHPCEACFRRIINVGATRVVIGGIQSHCVTAKDLEAINLMNPGIIIDERSVIDVMKILIQTLTYTMNKIKESDPQSANAVLNLLQMHKELNLLPNTI